MYNLFTFDFGEFQKKYVMTTNDAQRYASVTNGRIIRVLGVKMIGQIETNNYIKFVFRDEYNRLITEDCDELTDDQKKNIMLINEEPIII